MSLVLVSHLSLLGRDLKSKGKKEVVLARRSDDSLTIAKKQEEESSDNNPSTVEELDEDVGGSGYVGDDEMEDGCDQCDQSYEARNQKMFQHDSSVPREDKIILDGGWREVKCKCEERRHYVWTSTPPSMEPGYEWELDVPPVAMDSSSGSCTEPVESETNEAFSSAQSVAANDYHEMNEFAGPEEPDTSQVTGFQVEVSRDKLKKTRKRGSGSRSEMQGGCRRSMSPCRDETAVIMGRKFADDEPLPPDLKYPVLDKGAQKESFFTCPYCFLPYIKPNGLIRHFRVHKDEILKAIENGDEDCVKRKGSKNVNKVSLPVSRKTDLYKTKTKEWKLIPCSVVLTRCDNFTPKGKQHVPGIASSKTSDKIKSTPSVNDESSNKTKLSGLPQVFSAIPKPYNCKFCRKKFPVASSLNRHLLSHNKEKPHKCHLCSKSFLRPVSLRMHIRTHTGERPYQCQLCLKSFTQRSILECHIRSHTSERPHQCETCSKTFRQIGSLKYHIRIHTGERPHQCETCSKTFRQPGDLKKHIRTHTGERPYQCEMCSKTFSVPGALTRHIRTHSDDGSYKGQLNSSYNVSII